MIEVKKVALSAWEAAKRGEDGAWGIPVDVNVYPDYPERLDNGHRETAVLTVQEAYALVHNLLAMIEKHDSSVAHIERLAADAEYAARFDAPRPKGAMQPKGGGGRG